MADKLYNWPRFWHGPGEVPLDSNGFLINPDAGYGKYLGVKSLDDISGTPCLVLLGEPGMGKSHAMKAADQKMGARSLLIELGKLSTVDELSRRLFNSPKFRRWQEGNDTLFLFLDSLDEGRLLIETVHHFLIAELRDIPQEDVQNRLRFRISCRTADWPSSFDQELKELWGEESFGAYQLGPLRQVDIQTAAVQEGLDSNRFLAEVVRQEAGPLASRPVTLKMLLDVYREEQALPGRQIDLYEKGCLSLCEDPNRGRRENARTGKLEAAERLEVSSRIAAMMVFGNRRLIRRDSLENPKEGEISIRDLTGDYEPVRGQTLPVGEGAVSDVLHFSSLFAGAGAGVSSWSHQTYSEFLAARYLIYRKISPEKVLALITHPEDPEKKIAPQLHEAAAWLASLSDEIFKRILKREPEVLLRSDVGGLSSECRASLAEELLRRLDSGDLLPRWDVPRYFHKLGHPGLSVQLRPYITDSTKRTGVREMAIAIAEKNTCEELAPDLLALALSPNEPEGLRADAISALTGMASHKVRSELRVLIDDMAAVTSHILKAKALSVLWPSQMSSQELFTIIGAARSKEELRKYQSFLASDFAEHLEGVSVIPALQWIGETSDIRKAARTNLKEAVRSIMEAAWRSLDEAGVAEAFARMLITLAEEHVRLDGEGIADLFRVDTDRRQKLLAKIFEASTGEEVSLWVFAHPWRPPSEDTPWLLDMLEKRDVSGDAELLARLITNIYDRTNRDQAKAVAIAAKRHSSLKALLQEASKQRRQQRRFERQQEAAKAREEAEKARHIAEVGRPSEKVDSLLRQFESGDLDVWWAVDYWVRIADDLEHELSGRNGDLTKAPGWLNADKAARARLVSCAAKYILSGDPHTEDWIDPEPETLYRLPNASYRALRLVFRDKAEGIEAVQWKRWAPAVLHFWAEGGTDTPEVRDSLLKVLVVHAGKEVHTGLRYILERKIRTGERLDFLLNFDSVLRGEILDLVWSYFRQGDSMTETEIFILRLLLRKDFNPAYEYTATMSRRLFREGGRDTEALSMVGLLASEGKGCGWDVVWPLCLEDTSFGRKLWLTLGQSHGYGGLRELFRLPQQALGELFLWLSEQSPSNADANPGGESGLTAWDEFELLQGRILQFLAHDGTLEACTALENICRVRPGLIGVRYSLSAAWQNYWRNSYPWPTPRQVVNLAADAEIRVVRTASELLDTIVEGLKRLQLEFRQETPAVKKHRPKSENQVSDYIKRYLDRVLPGFGVIVNREVENRPRVGAEGDRGERTDILVNVRAPESQKELTVIIETKGCWNGELLTAMENQLLGRYMRDNSCRHGLYLVCWFNCSLWDRADPRCRSARLLTLGSVRMDLEQQVGQLTKDTDARLRLFILNAELR